MELHEYPRPANDTGIGVHWAAGNPSAVGLGQIRDFWIPEMKSLGIKWVKLFTHDGAQAVADLLLTEGFMPVVRIYRPHPNPGRLSVRDLVAIDALIHTGVRYIEFNNEPENDTEWKGGRVPANGIDIIVEDAIADMEAILERGGMPAIPAVSGGSRWDIVGKIIEKGRRDLLDGPIWQAIHNYAHNRPLDYPYDIGNQEGSPYTERFFATIASERPAGEQAVFDPWHGRSLQAINQLRREYVNPGATVMDDPDCWLAYEFFAQRNRHHLGRSIPILSTEGGYVVGDNRDPRYPATTPDLHMAQTLEACRIMMGSSKRFKAAPDLYFCTMFSVLANGQLGSLSEWWENRAWYSNRWRGNSLPIVRALRAEPKVLRQWQNSERSGTLITLSGTVLHVADQRTIVLERKGEERARVELDAGNRYRFPDLDPGTYTVRVEGTPFVEAVTLSAERPETVLDLDLSTLDRGISDSSIVGHVDGGAGVVVVLLRVEDGEEWVTMAHEDGSFRFVDLPEGSYNIRVYPEGSRVDGIELDGTNQREVALAVDGWGYTVRQEPLEDAGSTDSDRENDTGNKGGSEDTTVTEVIRCVVDGHKNLAVQARAVGWKSESVLTGSAPQYGEFACLIPILSARRSVTAVGVEGQPSPSAEGSIAESSRVEPAPPESIFSTSSDESPTTDDAATVSPPKYSPAPTPTSTRLSEFIVAVDGVVDAEGKALLLEARVQLESGKVPVVTFVHNTGSNLPERQCSSITGTVTTSQGSIRQGTAARSFAQGLEVLLTDSQARQRMTKIDADGTFAFTELGASLYTVAVVGYESTTTRSDIALDGSNEVKLELRIPAHQIAQGNEEDRGRSAAKKSVIVGTVPSAIGSVAKLTDTVGNERTQIVAEDGRVCFEDLSASTYTLTIDGGYREDNLEVDGEAGIEVFFTPLATTWQSEVSPAGSMPGFSAIRVEVKGEPDLPVYLSKEEWDGMMARTGSKPLLGEFALEFSPLEPGFYVVEPEGLDVRAGVELTGLEAVWITFKQQIAPTSPNVVLKLNPGESPLDLGIESLEKGKDEAKAGAKKSEETDEDTSESAVDEAPPTEYLFITPNKENGNAETVEKLIAVLRYVAENRPQIGNDIDEAMLAKNVIVVGDVADDIVEALTDAGATVDHVSGNFVQLFERLNAK